MNTADLIERALQLNYLYINGSTAAELSEDFSIPLKQVYEEVALGQRIIDFVERPPQQLKDQIEGISAADNFIRQMVQTAQTVFNEEVYTGMISPNYYKFRCGDWKFTMER